METLNGVAAKEGVNFHYETTARSLIQNASCILLEFHRINCCDSLPIANRLRGVHI